MKKLPTVGGGTPPSHTHPSLGRYAPSGLVASLPRKDCAPPKYFGSLRHCEEPSPEKNDTKLSNFDSVVCFLGHILWGNVVAPKCPFSA